MSDKMYEMFCLDGFNHRKKMNNKIMWEEMGSNNDSVGSWYRKDQDTNYFKPKKQDDFGKNNFDKQMIETELKMGISDYEHLPERLSNHGYSSDISCLSDGLGTRDYFTYVEMPGTSVSKPFKFWHKEKGYYANRKTIDSHVEFTLDWDITSDQIKKLADVLAIAPIETNRVILCKEYKIGSKTFDYDTVFIESYLDINKLKAPAARELLSKLLVED